MERAFERTRRLLQVIYEVGSYCARDGYDETDRLTGFGMQIDGTRTNANGRVNYSTTVDALSDMGNRAIGLWAGSQLVACGNIRPNDTK